ncbi:hypothetical protein CDAR_319951 [Caerostris darwini]|uniref:Uncharacterized protein n=1 Tax=Caerostris darwini TaxID=1538125 RepID=A0AAV4MAC4_9ARAC|nr:hypothetical protein CDAR_319951 [Caerostris darwini]
MVRISFMSGLCRRALAFTVAVTDIDRNNISNLDQLVTPNHNVSIPLPGSRANGYLLINRPDITKWFGAIQ